MTIREITVLELAKLENAQIIDVRELEEFAAGHAVGAMSIPLGEIVDRPPETFDDAPVYLICQSGRRSSLAAEALLAQHHDVVNVVGGTAAWVEAGLPTIAGL